MEVVEKTRQELANNLEWRQRYVNYSKIIIAHRPLIRDWRRAFHEWSPLKVYLDVSAVNSARRSVNFQLRYLGQLVAILKSDLQGNCTISTTDRLESLNENHFGCHIKLKDERWDGKEAAEFRKFFKDRKGVHETLAKKKNTEHRLESLLLTEFSLTKGKRLRNIKPVTIGSVRFPMPTPIAASNHKLLNYRKKGGGIDMIVRVGAGAATHLCIMELKDENTFKEPPSSVIQQALAYSTFIRELLRSESGDDWWNIFGFHGTIPRSLRLYATCVMPSERIQNDYSFGNGELKIENDWITMHYLYFNENDNRISVDDHNTSLPITTG